MDMIEILGIAGSLRRDSFNRLALRAAQELAPAGVKIKPFELSVIPIYNQDEEKILPASVIELKRHILGADAILFATPEYNYSVPGVLKNAIDWASRPYGESAWRGKPAAIIGASPSRLGSARAQYHLRQILVSLDMPTLNQPEVQIDNASQRFDAAGRLIDATLRKNLEHLITALAASVRRAEKPHQAEHKRASAS